MLPQIFEAFTQADHSLDRAKGGLGLGLAVARGLLELQGGAIEARSDGLGQGTEITLRLPYAPEKPALAAGPLAFTSPPCADTGSSSAARSSP